MDASAPSRPVDGDAAAAQQRGRRLEFFTLGWNSFEAVIAISAAALAGSAALLGFGLDSLIESLSALVLLWRLQHDDERGRAREKLAQRLVGWSLLALAGLVAYEAIELLITGEHPAVSYVGIALAVASVIVMPLLARAKRRVAARINSDALHADSKQTDICAYLSAILLAGLGLHALFGWWWADSVAAVAMVPIIVWEGVNALRNKSCGCGSG
ncbi:MAG: cation transporter [Verrucomicrobiota bacterium]